MVETVVKINHLQKNFGKVRALTDITFDVHKGEVFGFIGPNGAGKSTTIRTLLGILRASNGSATIFGQDVWHEAVAIHSRIAYVPGDVYLWPNLTGGEVIDLFLKLNQQNHSAKTDELIKQFSLDPTKKSRTYSKGNRQKVALTAALSMAADLYIFDEPTSGLDPLNEEIFQKRVEELKQAGKSILLSSHILSEVERMCDRIGIIRQGKIIETGSLEEMRHLTRTVIQVQAKASLDAINQLAGVHDVKSDANQQNKISFAVDSEQLGSIMTFLAAKEIISLQSTPPTLEDLFLRYYNNDSQEVNSDAQS